MNGRAGTSELPCRWNNRGFMRRELGPSGVERPCGAGISLAAPVPAHTWTAATRPPPPRALTPRVRTPWKRLAKHLAGLDGATLKGPGVGDAHGDTLQCAVVTDLAVVRRAVLRARADAPLRDDPDQPSPSRRPHTSRPALRRCSTVSALGAEVPRQSTTRRPHKIAHSPNRSPTTTASPSPFAPRTRAGTASNVRPFLPRHTLVRHDTPSTGTASHGR